jgi:glycosyltransferase involved in cell wall biosynthesis
MACGCPVACSTAGSLPEVCGNAARYFDPTSVDEMVEAISTVLDDPAPLVAHGLQRAALFTWEATATRHEEIYRALFTGSA